MAMLKMKAAIWKPPPPICRLYHSSGKKKAKEYVKIKRNKMQSSLFKWKYGSCSQRELYYII